LVLVLAYLQNAIDAQKNQQRPHNIKWEFRISPAFFVI
jgi:hypothetical protein